ncbi:villin-4 isoform X2 [Tanacetum coccineum]|uniref:Villin-4 isoform X2 n=1 Tax=Tanacetum coccineum TaxID=301880 RepID=A0ABQ4X432_9ASTR
MSLINPFSVDDFPMYSPQFSESLPNTVSENSSIEEVLDPTKKPSKRRQKKTSRNDDEARCTSWTTQEEIALSEYGVPFTLLHACAELKDSLKWKEVKLLGAKRHEKNKRYKSPGSSSFNTTHLAEGSLNMNMEAEEDEEEEEALSTLMGNEYASLNEPYNVKKTQNQEAFLEIRKKELKLKGTRVENASILTTLERQNMRNDVLLTKFDGIDMVSYTLTIKELWDYRTLTIALKSGALRHDIHYWLGKDTSQDEAGTAALKTVELDAALGGRAVQYREVQGHETERFLSYFKPCIIPQEGGIASGFKHVEAEEYKIRMFTCQGKHVVHVKEVPFARSSLNHDDIFILDTANKIFQFNGSNSCIQERAKALEVVQHIKDTYHDGKCDIATVEDGKLMSDAETGEFWGFFGGFAPLPRKTATDDTKSADALPTQLFCLEKGQAEPVAADSLTKELLDTNKCYLLDCVGEIYVWMGRGTSLDERKAASGAAEEYLRSQDRTKSHIIRVIENFETVTFRSKFDTWPQSTEVAVSEDGRGKVAALLKRQGLNVRGLLKAAPTKEEPQPYIDCTGNLQVWRVNGQEKTLLPVPDQSKFYCGECYIFQYTCPGEDQEECLVGTWFGKHSVEEDRTSATSQANKMVESLKFMATQMQIYEGNEPILFFAIFQSFLVLKGGLSDGYKNSISEKELPDDTYKEDGVALFRVQGSGPENMQAIQVEPKYTDPFSLLVSDTCAGSEDLKVTEIYNFNQDDLMTEDVFILDCHSSIFVWVGQQVDQKLKAQALAIGQKFLKHDFLLEKLSLETPIYIITEGSEPQFFTRFFTWDSSKSAMHGNSFQRKLSILKNGGRPTLNNKPKRRAAVSHGGRSVATEQPQQRSRSVSFSPDRVRVRGRSPAFNALASTFENANARNLSTPPPQHLASLAATFEQPPREPLMPRSIKPRPKSPPKSDSNSKENAMSGKIEALTIQEDVKENDVEDEDRAIFVPYGTG